MRRGANIWVLGLVIMVFSSCVKDDINLPESNDPVFTLTGSLGNEQLDIVAGDDGFYMNTYTDVSHGVNVFSGMLSDGNSSVEIGIYDGNLDQNNVTTVGVIKQSNDWAWSVGQDLVIFSKGMFPNHHMINQITWTIDGAFAGTNTVKISEPGVYNVCAHVLFNDGTSGILCNDIIVGFVRNANFRMRHYASQSGELNLWLDEVQGTLSTISWYIDGELVSKSQEYSGNISSDQHLVTVEVNFTNGTQRIKSMVVDGTVSGHFIDDFTGFEQCIQNVVKRDYNWKINARWNGINYSSVYADNSNSTITVNDMTYYGLNSNGKKVYKLDVTVDGKVRRIGTTADESITFNTVFGLELSE